MDRACPDMKLQWDCIEHQLHIQTYMAPSNSFCTHSKSFPEFGTLVLGVSDCTHSNQTHFLGILQIWVRTGVDVFKIKITSKFQ